MAEAETKVALIRLADLLQQRRAIEAQISQIIGRPGHPGHIGEFVAATVFDISLHASATNRASDGVFRSGPLVGRSVNIKWYSRAENLLDLATSPVSSEHADIYLVLTGPRSGGAGREFVLPWTIEAAYVFDSHALVEEQLRRGVAIGTASSVPRHLWQAAMVYPASQSPLLQLDERQRFLIALFHDPSLA